MYPDNQMSLSYSAMEFERTHALDRINRLTCDVSEDHEHELRELKMAYNRIIDDMENNLSGVPNDILDVFPVEVWIQIVKYALPVRGYSSALLLLTMVSRKWMQSLASVPALWAFIDLRGSQQDSLAMIEIFKHLSGQTTLNISIYVPLRHDITLIFSLLENIAPRLREVAIRQDVVDESSTKETCLAFQLLLSSPQYTSSVAYIHLECGDNRPLYDAAVARLLSDNSLPPSLRGLHGWRFLWMDFLNANDCCQHLEHIESDAPIEYVLTPQIQLPALRSINIHERGVPVSQLSGETQEDMPQLGNLTSLRYKNAFREALVKPLTFVAPQLFYLELRIPYAKIPLLVASLQAATRLIKLSVDVEEGQEFDEGDNNPTDPPVDPLIVQSVPSLRELRLWSYPGTIVPFYVGDAAYIELLLNFLIKVIHNLYRNVEALEFKMHSRHSSCVKSIITYTLGLKSLRKLSCVDIPTHSWREEQIVGRFETLEQLDMGTADLLLYVPVPKALSLAFTWIGLESTESLNFDNVHTLCITYRDAAESMRELPENSFPSLQELTLFFQTFGEVATYGELKLTSFQFLSSITIITNGYAPHERMLCFALLYQPEKCPALNEIIFRSRIPDWDSLFLMLEKRNFLVDKGISKIRTITLPFLPDELHAPLASLLGGRYTDRSPNEDLVLGGAQELIFDKQMLVC
jgi:hypothetical protein